MQPPYSDGPAMNPESRAAMPWARDAHQMPRDNRQGSRNRSAVAPMRSEDSWIEVSSQPSTSSLSSAATTDDIITTGLRVERSAPGLQRRTRRKRARRFELAETQNSESSQTSSVAGSSQDEYEESDSEPEQVLSSSNEDVTTASRGDGLVSQHSFVSEAVSSGDDADDDDRLTALGPRLASTPFVPQPNIFSHAPQYSRSRSYNGPGPGPSPSLVSNSSQATAVRHNSSSTARATRRNSRTQHTPYNMISPNYQADHDAALRASLSTLLSLGTAVRGVPKSDSPLVPTGPPVAPASSFRLVSESVAMGEETDEMRCTRNDSTTVSTDQRYTTQPKSVRSNGSSTPSKTKRKSSKDRGSTHAASSKKAHRTSMTDSLATVSPTLMTWVISAGVVVLFSAISFSAGYALGREVGHTEAGMGSMLGSASDPVAKARASAGCSRDAVQGSLKRLRWGSSGAGVSVYN